MTNSKLLTLFLILFSCSCKGQTLKELIVGDWIEVRRETRLGYVYTPGGSLYEPSMEFSFDSDGYGTFTNPNTGDYKVKTEYIFLGDTILVFGHICEIVQLDKNNLILIIRTLNKFKSDYDLKCSFIHKAMFDKLTKSEIKNLRAPSDIDIAYKDSCKQAREKKALDSNIARDFHLFVDEMPTFPGGHDAMKSFIRENLNYPNTSADCQGNVYLSFIVETSGELSNIKIEKSLCPDFDTEAIKLVQLMPKWTAGQLNGKTVRVKTTIPISFKLE